MRGQASYYEEAKLNPSARPAFSWTQNRNSCFDFAFFFFGI